MNKYIKNFRHWVKKLLRPKIENDPWILYKENLLEEFPPVNKEHYPQKELLLAETGLYVYRLIFLISEEDVLRLKNIIAAEFFLSSDSIYFAAELTNDRGLSIHIGIQPEFNGAKVMMFTNSVTLLASLDDLNLASIPPWIVFPDFNPKGILGLQGNLDYWWHRLFLPYWVLLEKDKKREFLQSAPSEWVEFIDIQYGDEDNPSAWEIIDAALELNKDTPIIERDGF
jgi:hypothetical protein